MHIIATINYYYKIVTMAAVFSVIIFWSLYYLTSFSEAVHEEHYAPLTTRAWSERLPEGRTASYPLLVDRKPTPTAAGNQGRDSSDWGMRKFVPCCFAEVGDHVAFLLALDHGLYLCICGDRHITLPTADEPLTHNATCPPPTPCLSMSKRTGFPVTTSGLTYRGLVENMSIPAELHERPDGRPYASFGSTVPIHCCTPEQVAQLTKTTHYYCDIFTNQLLAPLGELVFVRIDENTAEKVFINRNKRILLLSSDGTLAQWRFAPTFESANAYIAGTPIVNQAGELVSVVTAKKGNHYAVSTFEGEGGYFSTTEPWELRTIPEGASVYGDKTFASRDELRAYVASLPPIGAGSYDSPTPILYLGQTPRIVLVAKNGRQISHQYLQGVITSEIDYV